MRIKMLRPTIVDLKQVYEHDIVETDQRSALLLIGIGKAEAAPEPQKVVLPAEEQPKLSKPAPKRRKSHDSQPRV